MRNASQTGGPEWASFDHLAVAAMEDPAPLLGQLRAACPVGRSEQHGGFWVLSRYEDAGAAARQPELFKSAPRPGPGPGFPFSDTYPVDIPMIGSDPPLHRDFREPLHKAFSAASARRMEPVLRQIVTDLMDDFIETGEADLARELSIPFPAMVTSELLGLPQAGRGIFHGWAHEIVATGGDTPAFASLISYIDALYDLRQAEPGEDIPSQMLGWQIAGRAIQKQEWTGTVLLLILAGLDTTANGGALMLHFLGTRPDIRAGLACDPSAIPAAVEELLRWTTPVPQHSRGVAEDVTVGGTCLRKGDVVLLHWMSANRDPDEFPQPETFVPDRFPNRHYAFGTGPHRCLGAHLARVELRVLLEEVLGRLPDYELVAGGMTRYPSLNRGVSALRVTFPPGPRGPARRGTTEFSADEPSAAESAAGVIS
ncbi:MAG TPA: cytochrome P450 [Streptosporangiaceae bacterium]|nr:cytochrome P450 [Streptosporangiaceae bacterium]